jgi:hypothetical protein
MYFIVLRKGIFLEIWHRHALAETRRTKLELVLTLPAIRLQGVQFGHD